MKRKLVLLLVLFFTISFISNAYAEPYINKNFPSDEILKKAAQDLVPYGVGLDKIDILGNFKAEDYRYVIYFNIYHLRQKELTPFNLMKLDTDVWIISSREFGERILQK
jgi:hypothetical protein